MSTLLALSAQNGGSVVGSGSQSQIDVITSTGTTPKKNNTCNDQRTNENDQRKILKLMTEVEQLKSNLEIQALKNENSQLRANLEIQQLKHEKEMLEKKV